jgi:integrase
VGNQEGWAASSPNVATILKRAARISQALDDTELREVERLCAMVRRQPLRLCRMARERLAQFDDPAVLHRLLKLPDQCFTTADRMLVEGSSKRAAILHLRALALAILITKPLRREDLAQLDLATDFRRDKEGRIVGLSIPGHKTKTGRDEEAWFERPLIKRIQRHLQVFRPLLASSHSTYLFPGQVHGHRSCNVMSDELKQLVQNQVGAMFNAHLVRHIAVQLLLEDHPDNMPVAQRLIGHGDLRMTERFYGAGRSRGAQRHWGDLLQRKMKQLERKLKV